MGLDSKPYLGVSDFDLKPLYKYPLEIKKSANPGRDAIKHFAVLEKTPLEIANGGVFLLALAS
ncbi:MAG TPA: hypothetical protein VN456_01755 [Desulfosporosinus sp.]|nr:hypothetical protein [Desulfosporosinus sp.]